MVQNIHSPPNKKALPIFLWLTPILILFLAPLPFPYGYYTFLRIIVCAMSGLICFIEYKKTINIWVVIFGIFAVLYNPVFPIHLTRTIWTPINIITALFFIFHFIYYKKQSKGVNKSH